MPFTIAKPIFSPKTWSPKCIYDLAGSRYFLPIQNIRYNVYLQLIPIFLLKI